MAGKPKYEGPKRNVNLSLTETAIGLLEDMAKAMSLDSKSEVVEQFARGVLPSNPVELDTQQLGESSAV
jgi:hypothetical protein